MFDKIYITVCALAIFGLCLRYYYREPAVEQLSVKFQTGMFMLKFMTIVFLGWGIVEWTRDHLKGATLLLFALLCAGVLARMNNKLGRWIYPVGAVGAIFLVFIAWFPFS